MKVIRDAVHGDIELDPLACALLDTPEMQRLRGVKQLGTASLVYPSAVHTRFEHALGTYHLAGEILDRLAAAGADLSPPERLAVRVAALLHDGTHVPFGHTLEDERRLFERHDAPARALRFLRGGDVARAIDAAPGLRELLEPILAGAPAPPLLGEVVRGVVGADLLDYLARDAYFCGFRRTWDERLLRYFCAAEGRLALAIGDRGLARPDALSEVLHLLWLRYTLCERVYYHHAKVAAGAALSKAVELGLALGLAQEDLFALGDEGLLAALRARFAGRSPPLATLLERISARRLYKRAYALSPSIGAPAEERLVRAYHLDRAARAAAEAELAGAAGVPAEDVIVYCPAPGMAAKEADIPVVLGGPGGRPCALAEIRLPEVDVLVAKHRALWRFYVLLAGERMDRAKDLARACERLFGEQNQRRADVRGE